MNMFFESRYDEHSDNYEQWAKNNPELAARFGHTIVHCAKCNHEFEGGIDSGHECYRDWTKRLTVWFNRDKDSRGFETLPVGRDRSGIGRGWMAPGWFLRGATRLPSVVYQLSNGQFIFAETLSMWGV